MVHGITELKDQIAAGVLIVLICLSVYGIAAGRSR